MMWDSLSPPPYTLPSNPVEAVLFLLAYFRYFLIKEYMKLANIYKDIFYPDKYFLDNYKAYA